MSIITEGFFDDSGLLAFFGLGVPAPEADWFPLLDSGKLTETMMFSPEANTDFSPISAPDLDLRLDPDRPLDPDLPLDLDRPLDLDLPLDLDFPLDFDLPFDFDLRLVFRGLLLFVFDVDLDLRL